MTIKTHTIKVYKAADGHRWQMVARNGRIVAESGEAYRRPGACFKAACCLVEAITNGSVKVERQQEAPTK